MSDYMKSLKVKTILSNLAENGLLTEEEIKNVQYVLDIVEHPDQVPITQLVYKDGKILCKSCKHEIIDPRSNYCPNCGQRLHKIAYQAAYIAYILSKRPDADKDTFACQFCSLYTHGCKPDVIIQEDKWTTRYPICHENGILDGFLLEDKLLSSENEDFDKFCIEHFGGKPCSIE